MSGCFGPLFRSALLACHWVRRHKNKSVLFAGIAGLGFLVFADFAGHALLGENGERAATLLGAAFIALAHIRNYRICRSQDCDHH